MKKILLILPAALIVLAGCGSNGNKEAAEQAAPVKVSKPVAVVIAPSDFDEAVLGKVEAQLARQKLAYELVTIQVGKFVGPNGREVEVKKASWEVKPDDYGAVVFIGGAGMGEIAKDDTFVFMAQKFGKSGKKLVAFGEGNEVLRNAGLPDAGPAPEQAQSAGSPGSSDSEISQIIESLTE